MKRLDIVTPQLNVSGVFEDVVIGELMD